MSLFDPPTIAERVRSWALTMPADQEYSFCNVATCAVTQFMEATGIPVTNKQVFAAASEQPRTFGAFAERLGWLA